MDLVRFFTDILNRGRTEGQNDDLIDRLHWKFSATLIFIFSLIVTTKSYVGDPIDCWCPAEFTSNYVKYTEQLCWVKNTYYIPIDDDIPREQDLKPQLVYYQWTGFILLLQGLMFITPWVIWNALISHMGVNITDVVQAGRMFSLATKVDSREKTLTYIAKHIHYYLDLKHTIDPAIFQKIKFCCSKGRHNYLSSCYFAIKILYLVNASSQFFILDWLLGQDFGGLGTNIIRGIRDGTKLPESSQFPRITLCDFRVRDIGGVRRPYTVECVLSINLFNEKIFMILWFWLVIVCTLTAANLFLWIIRSTMPWSKRDFVRRHLKITDNYFGGDRRKKLDMFIDEYLRPDGLLTLRILATNSSDLVASEVTSALWVIFNHRLVKRPSLPDGVEERAMIPNPFEDDELDRL